MRGEGAGARPRLPRLAFLADDVFPVVLVSRLELVQNLHELADPARRQRPAGIHQRLVIGDPGLGCGQFVDGSAGVDDLRDDDIVSAADSVDLTYFNAGLRIYNVEDPRLPKEVGWFIPPQPTKRLGPYPYDKLVNQTENVLVDTRGNIFVTDRQLGLFVLRYDGAGEPAPTAK